MSETPDEQVDPVEQSASEATESSRIRGRFAPGHSGNPTGQKRGYASKVRKALQKILDEPEPDQEKRTKLDTFWRAIYAKSIKGDMAAARLIAERILPASFEADVNMAGMAAEGVLDVIGCIGEDYVRDGRLPDSTESD